MGVENEASLLEDAPWKLDTDYAKKMEQVSSRNLSRIAILGLLGLNYGFYVGIFNPMGQPLLKDVYGLDEDARQDIIGNIFMLYSVGGLSATLTVGPLTEKFGRRNLLQVFDILSVVSVLMYGVKNLTILQTNRIFSGYLGAGTSIMTSVILTELFPKRISGIANTLMYSCFTFCLFIAYITRSILSHDTLVEYWRFVLCFPLVPLTIKACLSRYAMPVESPKYLVKLHQDNPELEEHLKHAYRHTHRESEVHEITESCINVFRDLQAVAGSEKGVEQSLWSHIRVLFSRDMIQRTLGGFSLSLAHTTCGIGYFANYSTDLFDRISGNGEQVTFYYACAKVIGAVVAVAAMRLFGRKFNFLFGLSLQGFMIFVILISADMKIGWLAFVAIMIFSNAYAMGLGGCWMAYVSETLTPAGVSLAGAVSEVVDGAIGKLLPILSAKYGDLNILMCFGILALLHAISLDPLLIETKGKKEEQIIAEFRYRPYTLFNFS